VEADKIQVLVHPQSIVHSGVEFMDNSILCQLGIPDMRIPISLALGYPDRLENPDEELDMFGAGSNLTFMKPDLDTFSCLKLAYYAIGEGGSCPVVMNAANEVLVEKFLRDEIGFLDIQDRLCDLVYKHKTQKSLTLEDIISIDRETREMIR
jgi:1-deoxy-D-xylulose-5-phosphate reductoisomerase